jgi:hypothetical protein
VVLFGVSVGAVSLCGNWQQLSVGKCSLTNQCCNQDSKAIPSCDSDPPTLDTTSSIISQETYRFAGDGNYLVGLLIATGNSCPLTYTTGTVLFVVDTEGAYTVVGDNTDLGNGWQKVKYTPQRFVTTISKSNQPSFFTPGKLVNGNLIGPCMDMKPYLSDANLGCPCNGTWNVGSIQTGTTSSATRFINVSSCPNSTCPESFFFNTAPKYGNARITNTTNSTARLLEITQPDFNATIGYNNSAVYANFTADFSCPQTIKNTTAPTQSAAGHVALNLVPYLLAGIVGFVH